MNFERYYEENGYGHDLAFLTNHLALIECFISYKWCRAKSSVKAYLRSAVFCFLAPRKVEEFKKPLEC